MTSPGRALKDSGVVIWRQLIQLPRIPEVLIFALIQPVMFVLLFRYVFGGAIQTPGESYVNYLMPGIFAQTVAFGAVASGIGLAEDLRRGIIDRFRSLPMARSAVLVGRTVSDLVRNAADAASAGGKHVKVTAKCGADSATITVADDGPGLAPEIETRLFDSFTTFGKKAGTGLGLALVKRIAEEHHGSVVVDSRPGEGCTFTIRIPRA